MVIIPTKSAEHIAKRLEEDFRIKIVYSELNYDGKKEFPDGEAYVRVPLNFRDKKVVILHSGAPEQEKGLIELDMILSILNQKKVKNIEIFFTYFPYGQQDSIFKEGETNFAEDLIKKYIFYFNVRKIYVIGAHFENREWVTKYPILLLDAVDLLVSKAKKKYPDIVLIAPDAGSERRTGFPGPVKQRINSHVTGFDMQKVQTLINGKDVGVVDDLIETGGTLSNFFNICKKLKSRKVIAVVTHGVLEGGVEKIRKKYDDLILTNSIKNKNFDIDVSPIIAENLLR